MNRNKIFKLIASIVMLISGILMLLYQFEENKTYILLASVGYVIFGVLLVWNSIVTKKDK